MNKFISWYNQNRKILWQIIISILVVLGVIQILNYYYKTRSESKDSSTSNNTIAFTNNNISTPVIEGDVLDKENAEEIVSPIENFLELCNGGNIEGAYSILSNDCKEKKFPTIEQFKDEYIDIYFNTKKTYSIQAWVNNSKYNIYRVSIKDDYLSTGEISEMELEEYYTIVNENGEYKLNINGYVGEEEINKSNKTNDLEIVVKSKEIYMDYEIYNLQVRNYTQNTIKLDSRETGNKTYGIDNNEVKYVSYIFEKVDSDLSISAGQTREIDIKVKKNYSENNQINQLVFSDIILNEDEYKKIDERSEYKNRTQIIVNI